MSSPFLAEIRIFPFNFAPQAWATCDGQILPLVQNTALFSLLGTTYGGDGKSTFALPNLQGRAALSLGPGPGLTERVLGEEDGSDNITLLESEMPSHTHNVLANANPANLAAPSSARALARSSPGNAYSATATPAAFDAGAIAPTGGDQPHNNMMPYLTLNFCISLQGIYPTRP